MFGALVDYWYFTGDDTYNAITTQALLAQVGPNDDFMPPNQTKTEGNDDQAFWGMAALSAAEDRYPNPPADQPQWLALAQAVFNSQAIRWDTSSCNGGLKWQIFSFNNGYNYKNTISNGCFFNMAARLAVYTGNITYADWANKMYDWTSTIGLMSPTYQFFDGTDDTLNCSQLNHIQWSYNAGVFLLGAANMYNYVSAFQHLLRFLLMISQTNGSAIWEERLRGMITGAGVFFNNQVMYEVACEPNGMCNIDQRSFKAYLARWMAATMVRAPFTRELLLPLLQTSAKAAAQSCTGGSDGQQCGLQWTTGAFDGSTGVGEQMSAMEVIQSNLWDQVPGPVTAESGGISVGDPSAGTGGDQSPIGFNPDDISTGDRVGAGILTTMVLIGVIGGAWWMVA
jgi:mannan endo-1,6-alpha-mannosidase